MAFAKTLPTMRAAWPCEISDLLPRALSQLRHDVVLPTFYGVENSGTAYRAV